MKNNNSSKKSIDFFLETESLYANWYYVENLGYSAVIKTFSYLFMHIHFGIVQKT